ncbi:hypothetical protein [Kaarinaea lacus]
MECLSTALPENRLHDFLGWGNSQWAEAVELVVGATDPKIRVLSRYNKKLRSSVELTWEYLNAIVERIPGGLQFNRKDFGIDPRIRVFFNSLDDMQKLFEASAEINDLFTQQSYQHLKEQQLGHEPINHEQTNNAYVLLCMEKKEHTFFGMEMEGEILKREVQQVAVTFTNHELLAAAQTEQEAKNGLKCCALGGLLKKVRERMLQAHMVLRRLNEQKRDLSSELRGLYAEADKNNPLVMKNVEDIKRAMQEIELQILAVRTESESPNQHLEDIKEILGNPERYLKVNRASLLVNNMGIKLSDSSSQHGYRIDFAEVDIEQSLNRSAVVVNYSRSA